MNISALLALYGGSLGKEESLGGKLIVYVVLSIQVDEKAFEAFAVICGLALHHAKLYEKIKRSEQKRKIALDVLSYHSR